MRMMAMLHDVTAEPNEANAQEMQRIKAEAQKNGTFMKAPNGKESKLNERQWLQVRTGAFKEWFGDWENNPENASKIVDENGEPMVMYHGTDAEFTEFAPDKGVNFINGIWLSPIYSDAQSYGNNVMEFFVNIRNFATEKDVDKVIQTDGLTQQERTDRLKEDGYDGFRDYFEKEEYIAFTPSQIKSATANNGNFDSRNEDIRFMQTPDGTVFGFTDGTDVYLDENLANANTPIHEFGHLFGDWLKAEHPELWNVLKEAVRPTKYVSDVLASPAYKKYFKGTTREKVADAIRTGQSADAATNRAVEKVLDEAATTAIGDNGEAMYHAGDILGTARVMSALGKVWNAIKEFLSRIPSFSNININGKTLTELTPRELSKMTIDQLAQASVREMTETNELEDIKADIAAAEAETDTNPTEAQKKAGNYKMGHVKIQDFDISIENPKGSVRRGVDENGKAWETKMYNTYGYFGKTESKDGDHIDVFLGDNPLSEKVFVIDQINPETGAFDEHKVMFGFENLEDARKAYLSNYEKGWKGLGNITETDVETFRDWAKMDGKRIKPFAEYKLNNKDEKGNNLDASAKVGMGVGVNATSVRNGRSLRTDNSTFDGNGNNVRQRGASAEKSYTQIAQDVERVIETLPANATEADIRDALEKISPQLARDKNLVGIVQQALYEKEFASVIDKFFAGDAKDLQQRFFTLARTPKFMRDLGVTGNRFTLSYGVISRHFNKDADHKLTPEIWKQLPQAIQKPFAITRRGENDYRLYTTIQTDTGFVVVGVDVKKDGRDTTVNSISTVFNKTTDRAENETVIYEDKKITPRQKAVLYRHNSETYQSDGELDAAKVQKDSESTRFQVIKTNYTHKSVSKAIINEFKKRGVAEATSNSSNTTSSEYYKIKYKGVTYDFRFANHSQWVDSRKDATPDSEVTFDDDNKIDYVHISTDELGPKKADITGFINWVDKWNSETHDSKPDFEYAVEKAKHNPLFRMLIKDELIKRIGEIQRKKANEIIEKIPLLKEVQELEEKLTKETERKNAHKKYYKENKDKIDARIQAIEAILPEKEVQQEEEEYFGKKEFIDIGRYYGFNRGLYRLTDEEINKKAFGYYNEEKNRIENIIKNNKFILSERERLNNPDFRSRSYMSEYDNPENVQRELRRLKGLSEKEYEKLINYRNKQAEYDKKEAVINKKYQEELTKFGKEKYDELNAELGILKNSLPNSYQPVESVEDINNKLYGDGAY
ncbi:MAG: hypothetical protein LBC19_08970, partial [Tannerella sp.]|nr:hypothetical protein [Tannerella sp.]